MAEINSSTDPVLSPANAELPGESAIDETGTEVAGQDEGDTSSDDLFFTMTMNATLLERIDVFSGEWEDASVYEFVNHVKKISKFADWTDEETLEAAVFKLEGFALDSYKALSPKPKTFEDFELFLTEKYQKVFEHMATVKLLNCKQKYGQKVRQFFDQIWMLTYRAYESTRTSLSFATMEKICCMHFVGGLLPHIKRFLLLKGYENFQDAHRIAEIVENDSKEEEIINAGFDRLEADVYALKAYVEHNKNQSKATDQFQGDRHQKARQVTVSTKSNVRCWNCQKRGHKAAHCRYRR